MKKATVQLFLILSLCMAFVLLATRVFTTRFESGDLYPKYSTFRPDPFGSRVLFKTFGQLDSLSVDVASDPVLFEKETEGEGRVVFVLGLPVWSRYLPFAASKTLDKLASEGATVVMAAAVSPGGLDSKAVDSESDAEAGEPEGGNAGDEDADESQELTDMETWMNSQSLGFYVMESESLRKAEKGERILASPSVSYLKKSLNLSQPIGLEFKEEGEWQPLFEYEGNAVAAIRRTGSGQLVLFSDSYPFSNEGILNSDNTELLAWIVKDKQRVTFYESHLGVETYYGLIALARLYGFDSVLILFAVASVAFVWRGSFSPLPKEDSTGSESGLIDIDAVDSGLNGLLVRSVERKSLGSAIHGRWKKSLPGRRLSQARDQKIEEALQTYKRSEMKSDDLTAFYNTVVSILELKGNTGSK